MLLPTAPGTPIAARSRSYAYFELVRLPVIFTAMADIFLGWLLTHESLAPSLPFVLVLGASVLTYMAGMALNDFFDRQQDARQRPARPIPSGRVSSRAALTLGVGLLVAGWGMACGAAAVAGDWRPAVVGTWLVLAVFLYDGVLKRTWAAPIVMGTCRMLNVRLGMSLSTDPWLPVYWAVAIGLGVYVIGVTLFARREAEYNERPRLVLATLIMLLGVGVLDQAPRWTTGSELPAWNIPAAWHWLWGTIGLLLAWRCGRAIVEQSPLAVQSAVGVALKMLVVLDAVAVLAVQGPLWSLAILMLLLPAVILGRWLYST